MPFPDRDKLVFKYQVEGREVHADPLVLRRRLVQASGGMFDQILADAAGEAEGGTDSGPPAAMFLPHGVEKPTPEQLAKASSAARAAAESRREDARERRAKVVFEAFELTPIDRATGEGVTELEALNLLWSFLDYLEGNAGASGTTPQPSPSTGGLPGFTSATPTGSASS